MTVDTITTSAASVRELTPADVIRRWPRITAHLIAHSLGYFTPESAGMAIARFKRDDRYGCEWYHHIACQLAEQHPEMDLDARVREAARRALRGAIAFRRQHHRGTMASYEHAIALVRRVRDGGTEPLLASWF